MTATRPLLIVSLPATSLEDARALAVEGASAGADLAEIRIDLLPAAERGRLAELFPSPLPLIATYRSSAEGGQGSDDAGDRRRILAGASALPFDLIDREVLRDPVPDLLDDDTPQGSRMAPPRSRDLASCHLAEPWDERTLRRLLAEVPPGARLLKVVIPSTLSELWKKVLPSVPAQPDARLIVHTTGDSGPLLRAWAGRLGLPAVFASLSEVHRGEPRRPVEPSQIPIDRLKPFLDGSSAGPLFAVVGDPVNRSRSPWIHSRWLREHHLAGLYLALRIRSEEELIESLPHLSRGGFRGLNVTHPWKRAAFELASEVSPAAEQVRCANTLTLDSDGVRAENTDLDAMVRRLKELRQDGSWDGGNAVVIGAGGAARAALVGLLEVGAEVGLLARREEAAEELSKEFGVPQLPAPNGRRPASLLVHATTAGMSDTAPLAVPVESLIGPRTYVLDFLCAPRVSWMQQAAASAAARYEDGWRLLVYQAQESFELWTGLTPSADSVTALLEAGP